jgi:hypothetical protein
LFGLFFRLHVRLRFGSTHHKQGGTQRAAAAETATNGKAQKHATTTTTHTKKKKQKTKNKKTQTGGWTRGGALRGSGPARRPGMKKMEKKRKRKSFIGFANLFPFSPCGSGPLR